MVKVRGLIHMINGFKNIFPDSAASIQKMKDEALALFDKVLEAEREAFGDDTNVERSKKHLFTLQLDGVFADTNKFSPFGRSFTYKEMNKMSARRILFANEVKKTLGDKALRNGKDLNVGKSMIVIAGLPRTGSTMLHRLLAADSTTRTPLWWEQMHDDAPSPTKPQDLYTDPRSLKSAAALKKIAILSPNLVDEFNRFHKIGAYEVEECAPFMRRYFNDMDSPYLGDECVEGRNEWLMDETMDKKFIFTHLRAWIALETTAFDKDYSWVLKAPLFSFFMNEIDTVFPEASFVFTNRNPVNVVPSTCGMVECAASFKADWRHVILKHVGGYTVERMASFAAFQDRFISKKAKTDKPCVCINYKVSVKSPMEGVERIYKSAGRELTDKARAEMEKHRDSFTQHKHGKADYSMQKFGLTEALVEEGMADYKKNNGV